MNKTHWRTSDRGRSDKLGGVKSGNWFCVFRFVPVVGTGAGVARSAALRRPAAEDARSQGIGCTTGRCHLRPNADRSIILSNSRCYCSLAGAT